MNSEVLVRVQTDAVGTVSKPEKVNCGKPGVTIGTFSWHDGSLSITGSKDRKIEFSVEVLRSSERAPT